MRLVFEYTNAEVFSLHSLSDFYRTANSLCRHRFGVSAPEGMTEIRVPRLTNHYSTPKLLFLVTLVGGEGEANYKAPTNHWKTIAKDYNWVLKGILKSDFILRSDIDARIDEDHLIDLESNGDTP